MHATPGGQGGNHLCCVVQVQCPSESFIQQPGQESRRSEINSTVDAIGNCLVVNACRTQIIISAQTTFRCQDVEAAAVMDVEKAFAQSDLRRRHIDDYQDLFGRLQLRLAQETTNILPPTDIRLLGPLDPSLIVLYHNFGRYLLISCSRPGSKALPATLQGLWNPSFHPAWGSKYTININTEMNYWPASLCNLAECESPLFDHLERMAERGKRTAELMYGCRGWAAHHNTDIWADTDPQDRYLPATCEITARFAY
jgi:hypothetical protein